MAKEICISSTPHETRLAILEDDQLAEIYYERENEYTLAGSIYNGRVTRVLPGMQSAFVDVGLERDAFLYVTDFLELEDPEETDELEKAAASGGNQPPREVRHPAPAEPAAAAPQGARNGGRLDDRAARPVVKQEQKSERQDRPNQDKQVQDRPQRDRRPVPAVPAAADASVVVPESLVVSEQGEGSLEESGPGARRWRGRRRRRGGRGPAGSPEAQTQQEETAEIEAEAEAAEEIEISPTIFASAAVPAPRIDRAPVAEAATPFVLPGESLSKYGATPAVDAPKAASPAPPASSFKPSTLIETPLAWDGSGLMPGESISRHRERKPEPIETVEEVIVDLSGVFSDAAAANETPASAVTAEAADEIEEEEFVEEMTESPAATGLEVAPIEIPAEAAASHLVDEQPAEEDEYEETSETAPETGHQEPAASEVAPVETKDYEVETEFEQPSAGETLAEPLTRQDEVVIEQPASSEPEAPAPAAEPEAEPAVEPAASEEPQSDASASHNVDPAAPTGFRLFGLGGKKKTEEEAPAPPPAKAAPKAPVSSYAPGSGPLEIEEIEEEEFDAPHPYGKGGHHGKPDLHDNEDFEEETLRTGALGELLQEAHLGLAFDEKNGDEEAFDDEEEDDDALAEGQPAGAQGQGAAQQPKDRGGRGRRGRGGPPGQSGQNRRGGPSRRSMQTSDLPIISDLLKPGQEILVQIAKEPIAKKGARITSHIALPGRFLVFMPTVTHIGVSRKIASDEERQRLKRILVHERGEAAGGFIVRTAAEGASEEDLRADLRMLLNLWSDIKQRSEASKSPALIFHDLSLIERILRDQVSSNFANIWVDSEENYERIVRFLNRISPSLTRRVKLYTKEVPLFEHFGIQDEISKALRSKVWLKSGGSIVINQTEALVAIDINTGKYVGKSARLEDTILKTNMDAVPEIVRQIRLRDLGGIIVIDFIDMDERKNRFKVMAALEEALKSDRAPTKVLQFNDFGLVAITRKRVKQSLERTLSVPCPTCQATGMVKSPTTVCNEIYTEMRKMKKHFEGADVLLRVNPETVKVLKANNASWMTELEELIGKNILIKSDATLHPEQFDIQG
jgi:ribonuclease G